MLNALTFAVVAVVLYGLPSKKPETEAAQESVESARPAQSIGLREALGPITRPLLGLTVLNVVVGFVWGGMGVITVILSVQIFNIDEGTGTGLLNSAIGVGGVLGAWSPARWYCAAARVRHWSSVPLLLGLGLALLG